MPFCTKIHRDFNAAEVLNSLRQIDIQEISLKQVTVKTTMLIALISGQRVQSLQALMVQNVKDYDDKCEFYISALLKQSKQANIFRLYLFKIRGMFEMNCLLSSSSISAWGTVKTNTYLYRVIQYLHNGV